MSRIRRDVVVLVASLAVFAVCAVIAVNGLPEGLYGPMLAFQYLSVVAMPLVVAVGALAFRRWRLAAALVLVVPASSPSSGWSSCWSSGSGRGPQSGTRSCVGCTRAG